MAYFAERNGKVFVQIRRRVNGKEISKSKTFPNKTLARAWAAQMESDVVTQKHAPVNKVSDDLLSDLIDRYFEEIGGTKGFGRNKEMVLRYLKRTLGHLKVSELTSKELQQFATDRLKAGAGGVTIGIDLTYLKSVLKCAKDLWDITPDFDAIKAAKASLAYKGVSTRSRERDRRPTQSEIDRLVAYFNAKSRQQVPMGDIILFAVETAMRQGEITRIRWPDLDDLNKTIIIRDRKHPREKVGNDCEVPLLGTAMEIVLRQPKDPLDDRIFPFSEDTVSTVFTRACSALAIDDLRFHDLRHEGVSRLFEKGYTIEQVALVSGHRDWAMLRRYTQLRAKDLHKVFPQDVPQETT